MSRRSKEKAARARAKPPGDLAAAVRPRGREMAIGAAVLVAATLLTYLRVRHSGFIWDDDMHLTQNPCIIGPLGLEDIWTTRAARICPLVLTTFWAEHRLWGLDPVPYHVFNVLMHAACAVVLWCALAELGVRGSWLGAALWALHPVQVETVAWITELKNTQSCLFYLLAILLFSRWVDGPEQATTRKNRWRYGLSLVCAALAMASKSSTVVLPIVLGLCAWWRVGRLRRKTLLALIPYLALSAASSALTLWTQNKEGANEPEWALSVGQRIAACGKVFWFYLGKLAWPHPLVFIYPRWNIDPQRAGAYAATAAMCGAVLLLWRFRDRGARSLFFACAYFLAALIPVLGIANQFFLRYSFVGDHFQYLASMGPMALAGAGIATVFGPVGRQGAYLRAACCAALLAVMGVDTFRQTAIYSDSEALWTATVARNPGCWLAQNNLGALALREGRIDEAAGCFQKALEVGPETSEADTNLGNALLKEGRIDEAFARYTRALEIEPGNAGSHVNLGEALRRKGRLPEAADQFRVAAGIEPGLAAAHSGLGNTYLQMNRMDDAAAQYRRALEIDPRNEEARTNLGTVSLQQGRVGEAIESFLRVLEENPRNVTANANLGNALLQEGRLDEAMARYRNALAMDSGSAETHNDLGFALLQKGSVAEAIVEFREALRISPGYRAAHKNLGSALFRSGRIDEGEAEIQKALRQD